MRITVFLDIARFGLMIPLLPALIHARGAMSAVLVPFAAVKPGEMHV